MRDILIENLGGDDQVKTIEHGDLLKLSEEYEEHFLIGAAVNPKTLISHQQLLKQHFNSITAENEMKFERLQPIEGQFQFEAADQMLEFAKQNNMGVRGHTLVWHNQTPAWIFEQRSGGIVDRATLLERMKTHIDTVVTRYKGNIYAWDVVNEAISDSGNELLRSSKWLDIAGEQFIAKAFEYAHAADPSALLFYNDYNESDAVKREKIYRLVKSLKEKDIPIHGIGMQSHWNLDHPAIDDIRRTIEQYASLDVTLHITEMDLSMFHFDDRRTDCSAPTEAMLEKQAERYDQIFKVFREYSKHITSVTFWGAADDYTWLDHFPVQNRKNWPFLFDALHQPKQSFWNVINNK